MCSNKISKPQKKKKKQNERKRLTTRRLRLEPMINRWQTHEKPKEKFRRRAANSPKIIA